MPFFLLRGFTVGVDGSLYDGLPGHGALSDGRMSMQAFDQVQVLKGASAFLFGAGAAGSLGGTINYLPKRPTDGPLREVGVGYPNRSLFGVDADLGDRFGDNKQFGYRVNLGIGRRTAVEGYGWEQKVATVAFDWRAARGLVFGFDYAHNENQNPELPPFYFIPVPRWPLPARRTPSAAQRCRGTTSSARRQHLSARRLGLRAQLVVDGAGADNHKARPGTKQARFGSINNAAGNVTLFAGQEVSSETPTAASCCCAARSTPARSSTS